MQKLKCNRGAFLVCLQQKYFFVKAELIGTKLLTVRCYLFAISQ